MTEITHDRIRDVLPDLVNTTLDEARRREVEDHLRSCSECASELRVLQMVKDAPSFAPVIDAVKVSSAILPYGGVPVERPRPGMRSWQALSAVAALLLVVAVGVSRGHLTTAVPPAQVACADCTVAPVNTVSKPLPTAKAASPLTRSDSPVATRAANVRKTHELQLAAGLEDLSDGNLAQLASEIDALDALPSAEPENLGVADAAGLPGGGL